MASKSSKFVLITSLITVIILIIIIGFFYFSSKKDKETNLNKTNLNNPVVSNTNISSICPLNQKFTKDATHDVECQCPQGYSFKSEIIGYNQCAGAGSECPILSVECVANK